jgi:superfamily II DNA or RNA helicase
VLSSLKLLPVYDSAEHDLIRELQVPLLMQSNDYLRGVGYFTSGWLGIAAEGMANLVQRGGRARFVVSPILEEGDWAALQLGDAARFDLELRRLLGRRVKELASSLERDTLNALAWMVADDDLEFRFAVPRLPESRSFYHDKVGVFRDGEGNAVVVHGSLNDSVQGSLNGEAFSVFQSWLPGQQPYAEKHIERLEALWSDSNRQFRVCCTPDAIREQFIRLRRSASHPYRVSPSHNIDLQSPSPRNPIELRQYQNDAVEAWVQAGCRGVFEMATGTGKTVTALAAAVNTYSTLGRIAVIVLVPYLHLLEQWARDCRNFGFSPVLCSSEHDGWQIEVKSRIQDYNLGVRSNLCILAVHMTGASRQFSAATSRLQSQHTLIIGDEVHGLGASHMQNAMNERAGLRLGLSATPRRWYDDPGTAAIFSYFGNTCFEFSLEAAIRAGYLTPYRYHPQPVSLTDDEVEQYEALTNRLTALTHNTRTSAENQEKIKKLLLRRATIVSRAQAKLPAMLSVLQGVIAREHKAGRETHGVLVYCAPGTHREALRAVGALGLRCHEFVHTVTIAEREHLLQQFADGDIQALVAVKCLDEGVDLPATSTAFLMASSTNPREFVQRRGRILRLSPGKHEAVIYDFLVVPASERTDSTGETELSVLRREMPRFVEFASCAKNEFEARQVVRGFLDRYEMLNLLDEKPWDVYHQLRQWDWSTDD